jgi:hypothetical protein
MPKNQINQFDATAANNTDLESISCAEGMAPSSVNNWMRGMMRLQKLQDVGTHAMTSPVLTSVTINGGAVTGITDITVADGGTGASSAAAARTNLGLVIGTDVEARDADILKADTTDELQVGYTSIAYSAGTKSSGTYTPDPALGNFQHATSGGAHTLAPPASNCTMVLLYKNNASAGTVTTSGFTIVDGDDLTTTNGHEFFLYITRVNDGATTFSLLTVKALQ